MNKVKIALLALFAGMSTQVVKAEEVTEDFESVTITDADSYGRGTTLSNGWFVQGGYISTSNDTYDYGFWTTAYNSSSKSLTAQAGSSNNAYVIIPQLLMGDVTFYYRKTSSDARSAGKVYAYKVTENEGTYTIGTRIFMDESATSSWQQCTSIKLTEPTMIAFKLVRAAIDDVTYNTASLEPHEHSYASEWSSDAEGHWHACTSEVGICDAKKTDVAVHDGLTCSVCGYETPGIKAFPWTEDFEGIASGIPALWDNSEGTTTTASYKWNFYNGYSEGKSLRFDSYNNKSGITNVLATPLLYIPSTGVYELKFKVKNPTGGNYEVKIAEYGSAERTTLLDNLTNIASWTEKTVDLSSYAGRAVKIYFCGTSNWGSGDAYLYLDDVTVKESIKHNHDYADAWSHDNTSHWHECTSVVGECDALKADVAAHTFDAEGICTVCGYDQPYMEDFENGIPESWTNNGFVIASNPSSGNGTKMAFAGSYGTNYTLTTPLLYAKEGDQIDVEALLPWDDETLTMECSYDRGETWTVAFKETPAANNTLCTLSWTAPQDGYIYLRFSGRYNYIDNICGFKLAEITLSETAETFDAIEKKYGKVTVNRTIKADTWNTFCVPFAMTAEEIEANLGADAQVKELTALTVDGTNFGMTFGDATSIEAGKPYMVKVASAVSTITVYDKTINSTLHNTTVEDGSNSLTFCGNLAKMNAPMDSYIISSNKFYVVNSEVTLKGFRGYFTTSAGAGVKLMELNLDDDATAIQSIDSQAQKQVYDLSGRRVNNAQKGIYIVNNKKVVK